MITRKDLVSGALLAALGPTALAGGATPEPAAPADGGLKGIARRAGRLYGAAVRSQQLARDAAFASAVAAECGVIVPEVEGKWAATQPRRGHFDFSGLADLLAFADARRMRFRGHCLVWHESLPDWLRATLAAASRGEAQALLDEHIAQVVGYTRARAVSWDVVNEAVDPAEAGPDHLRRTPWLRALGPDYIDLAFHAAHRADPAAKLVYNDFGTDYADARSQAKRTAILRLLRGLKGRGVPVHALGIQAHLTAGNVIGPGPLGDFVQAAAALGLELYVTELDVTDLRLPAEPAARDAAIAAHAGAYLGAVSREPAFKGVITWGLSSRYSWLNRPAARRPDGTLSRGLPLDSELRRTPMWGSLAGALGTAASVGR